MEVTWKSKLKAQFPNPNEYSAFMGDFSSATGTVTLLLMLASRFIFARFGWGVAALITPTVLLLTGVVFFGLILFGQPFEPALAAVGLTPLFLAVLVGAAQNIFSKSSKYSLFDPCKETAYIPLDDEIRTKGKAAIDVICNPLGKSGGALIQQVLIIGFGSLAACVPYLGAILVVIVGAWIVAARSLDKQFTALQKEEMRAKLAEAKKELIRKHKAVKRYRFKAKATDEGFVKGQWVPVESKDISEHDLGEVDVTKGVDSGKESAEVKGAGNGTTTDEVKTASDTPETKAL